MLSSGHYTRTLQFNNKKTKFSLHKYTFIIMRIKNIIFVERPIFKFFNN